MPSLKEMFHKLVTDAKAGRNRHSQKNKRPNTKDYDKLSDGTTTSTTSMATASLREAQHDAEPAFAPPPPTQPKKRKAKKRRASKANRTRAAANDHVVDEVAALKRRQLVADTLALQRLADAPAPAITTTVNSTEEKLKTLCRAYVGNKKHKTNSDVYASAKAVTDGESDNAETTLRNLIRDKWVAMSKVGQPYHPGQLSSEQLFCIKASETIAGENYLSVLIPTLNCKADDIRQLKLGTFIVTDENKPYAVRSLLDNAFFYAREDNDFDSRKSSSALLVKLVSNGNKHHCATLSANERSQLYTLYPQFEEIHATLQESRNGEEDVTETLQALAKSMQGQDKQTRDKQINRFARLFKTLQDSEQRIISDYKCHGKKFGDWVDLLSKEKVTEPDMPKLGAGIAKMVSANSRFLGQLEFMDLKTYETALGQAAEVRNALSDHSQRAVGMFAASGKSAAAQGKQAAGDSDTPRARR